MTALPIDPDDDELAQHDWPDAEPVDIPDLYGADRELRRIARIRDERDRAVALVTRRVDRLTGWLRDEMERLDKAEAFPRERLERYHRAVLELDPKATTISLPSGKLSARKQQPEWEWTEGVFLGWAAQHAPELVRLPEPPPPGPRLDVNAAKELLTRRDEKGRAVAYGVLDGGETPPGVTVTYRERKFAIELTNPEGDQ